MIEALVSAVLVAIMAVAFFGALNGSERVSGVAKLRAESAALAQDDQERMRSMPVSALNNLVQSKTEHRGRGSTSRSSRAPTGSPTRSRPRPARRTAGPRTTSRSPPRSPRHRELAQAGGDHEHRHPGAGELQRQGQPRDQGGRSQRRRGPRRPRRRDRAGHRRRVHRRHRLRLLRLSARRHHLQRRGSTRATYVDPDGDPTPHTRVTINDQQVATQGFTLRRGRGGARHVLLQAHQRCRSVARRHADSSQWKLVMFNGSLTPRGRSARAIRQPFRRRPRGSRRGALAAIDAPLLFPFTSAYGVYAGQRSAPRTTRPRTASPTPACSCRPAHHPHLQAAAPRAQRLRDGRHDARADRQPPRQDHAASPPGAAGGASSARPTPTGLLDDPGVPYGTYTVCADTSPIGRHGQEREAGDRTIVATSLAGAQVPTSTSRRPRGIMLTRAARDESGQTLMELLIGMVIGARRAGRRRTRSSAAATPAGRAHAGPRRRLSARPPGARRDRVRAAFAGLPAGRHRRHHPHDLDRQRDLVLREHGRRRRRHRRSGASTCRATPSRRTSGRGRTTRRGP